MFIYIFIIYLNSKIFLIYIKIFWAIYILKYILKFIWKYIFFSIWVQPPCSNSHTGFILYSLRTMAQKWAQCHWAQSHTSFPWNDDVCWMAEAQNSDLRASVCSWCNISSRPAGRAVASAALEHQIAAGGERGSVGAAEAIRSSRRQHGSFSSGTLQTQWEREVPHVRGRPGEDREPAAVTERPTRPRGKHTQLAGRRRGECRREGEELFRK